LFIASSQKPGARWQEEGPVEGGESDGRLVKKKKLEKGKRGQGGN